MNKAMFHTERRLPPWVSLTAVMAGVVLTVFAMWVLAITLRTASTFLCAALVSSVAAAICAWAVLKIVRWRATIWIGSFLLTKRTIIPECGTLDVCFLFVDHFEPNHGGASPEEQLRRVRQWESAYEKAAQGHVDSDGRCPQHTWFIPIALLAPEAVEVIAEWPRIRGWGEIEYHLHHGPDMTETEIRQQILGDVRKLQERGALSTGRYGFVHGMSALAAGDLRYCTAVNEIDVLLETGCYADFTFSALDTPAQPKKVNSIYRVSSTGRAKPHDDGLDCTVGARGEGLVIVQSPLCFGFFPDLLDDAEVCRDFPPHPRRIKRWLNAHVHVKGRPNWIFITVHSHSTKHGACDALFSGPMQELWRGLEDSLRRPGWRLHYFTAREAYNLIRAAEAGCDGNPNDYRDHEIPPPRKCRGAPVVYPAGDETSRKI